ncbi:hypothetical protein EMQ25_10055 [Arsenicitalea aurantiaca]|uniref:DUF3035 domain-containing protein n=1 Tax=Arsenicitalea aurantiaca TaxID=1783274 RepID=A0A433XAS8_9HYPH|nr:hypothetical protein [Arsenicitalea aurantiaca]RUT31197.1 hypothetical protein EMQ25_10055 [Arsenicitalea aurantiaca]
MSNQSMGRGPKANALARTGLGVSILVAALALGACTTVEGTNALTDIGTFEREVMSETLRGVGMLERDEKEETGQRRAPLVLPRQTASLPAPQQARTDMLPADSDRVQIDASNLTEADLQRLRNARVVDARTLAGRPLTEQETRQLTARMTAAQVGTGPRPLYLPPDRYFTTVGGQDTVCLAPSGQLVPISDPSCPAEVRAALASR